KNEMINITDKVRKIMSKKGWQEGIIYLSVPHTTAGITLNENADPDVKKDMLNGIDEIIPKLKYDHFEGNSPAHIKSSLIGTTKSIMIEKSEMVLGTWQGIYFCEFDGPRERKVYLKFLN
ncbi:MAG: secondary thiamine-phosphate synthase enzyme YjbQ, partial [Fusobacteriota bacterium]